MIEINFVYTSVLQYTLIIYNFCILKVFIAKIVYSTKSLKQAFLHNQTSSANNIAFTTFYRRNVLAGLSASGLVKFVYKIQIFTLGILL